MFRCDFCRAWNSTVWRGAGRIKELEDTLSAEQNLAQQKDLRDMINHSKSELEASTDVEQQRQATEIEAAQQLRTEQDKLNALEIQLDDLVRKLGNPSERSTR